MNKDGGVARKRAAVGELGVNGTVIQKKKNYRKNAAGDGKLLCCSFQKNFCDRAKRKKRGARVLFFAFLEKFDTVEGEES